MTTQPKLLDCAQYQLLVSVSALTTTPPDGLQPTAHFVRKPVFLHKPQAQLLVGGMITVFAVPACKVALTLLMPLLLMLAAGHVGWWLKGEHVTCNPNPSQWLTQWQDMAPYHFAAAKVLWAVGQLRLDIYHAVLDVYLHMWLQGWLVDGLASWLAAGRRTAAGWVNRSCPRGDIGPSCRSAAAKGDTITATQTVTTPSLPSTAFPLRQAEF